MLTVLSTKNALIYLAARRGHWETITKTDSYRDKNLKPNLQCGARSCWFAFKKEKFADAICHRWINGPSRMIKEHMHLNNLLCAWGNESIKKREKKREKVPFEED